MNRVCVAVLVAASTAISLAAQAGLPARSSTLPIRAGLLVDPEAGTVTANQTILVDGESITAIGANLSVPAGAEIIDLSKSAVLPGLFDTHTHLCLDVNATRDAANYFYTT